MTAAVIGRDAIEVVLLSKSTKGAANATKSFARARLSSFVGRLARLRSCRDPHAVAIGARPFDSISGSGAGQPPR